MYYCYKTINAIHNIIENINSLLVRIFKLKNIDARLDQHSLCSQLEHEMNVVSINLQEVYSKAMAMALEFDNCNEDATLAKNLIDEQQFWKNYADSVIKNIALQYKGANEQKLNILAEKKYLFEQRTLHLTQRYLMR